MRAEGRNYERTGVEWSWVEYGGELVMEDGMAE